jgi:hypothetical protein
MRAVAKPGVLLAGDPAPWYIEVIYHPASLAPGYFFPAHPHTAQMERLRQEGVSCLFRGRLGSFW